jgi:hypothetical protein
MTQTFVAVLILSAALIIAGLLAGGLYAGVPTNKEGNDSFYLVNRFTGGVQYCQLSECQRWSRLSEQIFRVDKWSVYRV